MLVSRDWKRKDLCVRPPSPRPSPCVPYRRKANGTTVSELVMTPTCELTVQEHGTLEELGELFGILSVAVYGRMDDGPQIIALKDLNKGGMTTHIVVGTPGRI
ncbi:hypothetical protein GSI_07869 [Ganoderma sinense ZZ0214-1]|uniref:Uncharacterized protein n=1 Tax=Ganoderma sinense ZZ0214-1 TaxID=1077348 RepID=A0A2G8S8V0_9APHY|nr:hypothetical protein GSI_07869 [Ganoderma sinense ZZ0214-1]